MQELEMGRPVIDRAAGKSWFPAPAETFSIAPSASHGRGADPKPARAAGTCPEIACIQEFLPEGILATARRRAGDLDIGADRVLVASGLIEEEDYVRALAASCGVLFDPLADMPRAACPLSDDRLIDSVAVGILPLQVDGRLVLAVAPRANAARRLTALFAARPDLTGNFRLTSSKRLHQFVTEHGSGALGSRATDGLRRACPDLSAAPRPRRPIVLALLGATAVLGLAAASGMAAPGTILAAVNLMLAVVFMAWIALRLFGSVVQHPLPRPRLHLRDDELPVYTVIVALYHEAASVETLIASLGELDYPPEKLDIKIVIEADDTETAAALARLRLAPPFQIVTAPDVGPRTKPKALNAALPFAQGTFTVIYDAEDRPERQQLRRALDMFLTDPALACVQARLTIDNTDDSWLARIFTAEYAGQFDVFLPGLAALSLPLPLGGSSNHFRTALLRKVGAWDPYNVTEDADLGMRLARHGCRSAVIDSTTYEEAPARFMPWLRQRTRWLKGWAKTWAVHMRAPRQLLRDLGFAGFVAFQLIVGGNVLAALVYPIFLAGLLYDFFAGVPRSDGMIAGALAGLHAVTLVAGFLAAGWTGWLGLVRRDLASTAWVLVLIPLYWLLLSLAAWRALYQLLRAPYRWEKTEHGLAQTSRLKALSSPRLAAKIARIYRPTRTQPAA
jgi:cellulose synthase/poly-beta-1,6-N-acetylglucosamine synthase-like glycosyltransferase